MANNLTLVGAGFDTSTPKFGSAALSGGYGVAPTGLLTSTPWAIGLWFKLATIPNSVQVMTGAAQLFWIGFNGNGTLHAEYGGKSGGGTSVGLNSASPPTINIWHFATISVSGTILTLTLDGSVVGTAGIGSTTGRYDTDGDGNGHATGYFAIRSHGGYEQAGTFQFNAGEIDEISVWNLDKFAAGFSPPAAAYTGTEAGLLALWHLDGSAVDAIGTVATTYTLSGPSSGTVGQASALFSLTARGTTASTVTLTPSDGANGGSFSPATVSLPAGTNSSASFTYSAASAGTKTLATTNNGGLSDPTALAYAASTAVTTIAANNPGIVYSPGVWLVGATSAKTINAGAYLRTIFTGSQCSMTFDVSANSTPLPQLYYRVDGVAWSQATLAATVIIAMPSSSVSWPHHYLEVIVKCTSEFLNFGSNQGGSRWSPQNAAVTLTGLSLGAGQSVSAPTSLGQSIWIYGDSITEGYHAVANLGAGSQDTDGSDALNSWAFRQRELLGAEVAVIGFGGVGINASGVLGVPNLTASFNLLWSGQARNFTPAPDLIVIAYGENDGTSTGDATFISNYKQALGGLLAATPLSTKIACLIPLSQRKAADIATAIVQLGNPRLSKVDTAGMFSTVDSSDGQHPLGVANLTAIGPAIANKLRPLLQGIRNRWVRI